MFFSIGIGSVTVIPIASITVQQELTHDEDKDILREHDVKFGPPVREPNRTNEQKEGNDEQHGYANVMLLLQSNLCFKLFSLHMHNYDYKF